MIKILTTTKWNVKELLMIFLFVIVILANLSDLFEDGLQREDSWLKILTIALSLWGIIMLIRLIKKHNNDMGVLNKRVEKTENNLELTHSKLKQIGHEYSIFLHKQFDVWKLSCSEKDVAMLLLKGLSFKEIAELRKTKEKTVRQQASAIYSKANVTGRHEFSAWFFEDLLV